MAKSSWDDVPVAAEYSSNPAVQIKFMSIDEALKLQEKRLNQLPTKKSWPFTHGPLLLAINAGLVGLVANSFFRRMLKVRKGLFLTSLPTSIIPALVVTPAWLKLITHPIILEKLECGVCADIRGGIINFFLGAAYPVVLAAPLSAALARRYETVKVPTISIKNFDKRAFVDFWATKIRYFKGQFITIALFQTVLGIFIASSQMQVFKEYLSKTPVKVEMDLNVTETVRG